MAHISALAAFAKRPPELKSAQHRKHEESGRGGISHSRATSITNLEKERRTERAGTVASTTSHSVLAAAM